MKVLYINLLILILLIGCSENKKEPFFAWNYTSGYMFGKVAKKSSGTKAAAWKKFTEYSHKKKFVPYMKRTLFFKGYKDGLSGKKPQATFKDFLKDRSLLIKLSKYKKRP